MSDIKLSVTIVLPGSTMMTSQECEKNPKENYDKHFMMLSVKSFDKKTKKTFFKKVPLEYKTRKCSEAQQVIRMSEEAYNDMVSPVCPEWFASKGGMSKWRKFSELQRLELHLNRVCEFLGGTSYTYDIYND